LKENKPTNAAFFAREILWNRPTIEESIKDLRNRGINISLKK
jgi:hypothetical protein